MTTESDRILQRYAQIEREKDEFGRLIGVHRLKPSEQTKIAGWTPELSGSIEAQDENGNPVQASLRLPLIIIASVCEVDGVKIPFPRSRGELDAMYDRLDVEGLTAASTAYARLFPKKDQADATAVAAGVGDTAKN